MPADFLLTHLACKEYLACMEDKKPLTVTELARMGGIARAKKLTKKQRLTIAKKASAAAAEARQKKGGSK